MLWRKNKNKHQTVWFGFLVCFIAGLFYCYEFVLRIIPGALQGELSSAFGNISATTFGQLSALYYFAYSPMQLPVGILMDRYGPRRLLSFASLLCTLGLWMFANTSSLWIAGAGRFLMGFGSSFAFVGVLSLATRWLPRRYFSLIAGLITTLGMLGLIYGSIKITTLSLKIGWLPVLQGITVLGAGLTLLIFLVVRDGEGPFAAPKYPWRVFFFKVGKVLISPQIWLISILGACLYTSLSVFGELWGKTYLEQAHHLTKLQAAKAMSFLFLGWAVGAPLAGYLSDRFERRLPILVLGAIFSFFSIMMILYYPNLSYTSLNLLLFLYGLFTSTEIIVFVMAKEMNGALLSGTVFSVVNMVVTLGGVVFQPLVGKLLDSFGTKTILNDRIIYSAHSYQLALSILPLALLLVILLSCFLNEKQRSECKEV